MSFGGIGLGFGGGGAAGYNPISLGWEVYANHTSLVNSGGFVGTWTDLSGNMRDLTEATNRPTYNASDAAFGGLPSATWDGVNDRLNSPSFSSGAFTFFMVCTGLASATTYFMSRYGASQTDYLYGDTSYSSYVTRGSVSSGWNVSTGWGAWGSTPKVLIVVCDGTTAGHKVILNDVVVSTTNPVAGDPSASENAALYIGLSAAWGGYAGMKASACGWRNGALNAAQITTLTTYQRGVYGI